MGHCWAVIILFNIVSFVILMPVFLKAWILCSYAYVTSFPVAQMSERPFLPIPLLLFGYGIFLLEGTQSSIIIANRQKPETITDILSQIDLTDRRRESINKYLSSISNHAPIEAFVVGRQLLIVAFSFIFKTAFDAVSLQPRELMALTTAQDQFTYVNVVRATYSVLDHWIFSTAFCAVLIAYFCQVPPKLMAQSHPMRFLATMPLGSWMPSISTWMGQLSLLTYPLDWLRKAGEDKRTSYFSKHKEPSPITAEQLFNATTDYYGEYAELVEINLSREKPAAKEDWFANVTMSHRIIQSKRDLVFEIATPPGQFANEDPKLVEGGEKIALVQTNESILVVHPSGTPEIPTENILRFAATFANDLPQNSLVKWPVSYLFKRRTERRGTGITDDCFETSIRMPVKSIAFKISGVDCSEPQVSIKGVDSEKISEMVTSPRDNTAEKKNVVISYPPIDATITFKFVVKN